MVHWSGSLAAGCMTLDNMLSRSRFRDGVDVLGLNRSKLTLALLCQSKLGFRSLCEPNELYSLCDNIADSACWRCRRFLQYREVAVQNGTDTSGAVVYQRSA